MGEVGTQGRAVGKPFRAQRNKGNPGPTGANRPPSGSLSLGKRWGKGQARSPPSRPATPDVSRGESRGERRHQRRRLLPGGGPIRGPSTARRKMMGKTLSPGPRRATRGASNCGRPPLGRAPSPVPTTLITAEEASPGKIRARSKV